MLLKIADVVTKVALVIVLGLSLAVIVGLMKPTDIVIDGYIGSVLIAGFAALMLIGSRNVSRFLRWASNVRIETKIGS